MPQQPVGLPFQLQMQISADGKAMTGSVQNAMGLTAMLQMQHAG